MSPTIRKILTVLLIIAATAGFVLGVFCLGDIARQNRVDVIKEGILAADREKGGRP